MISLFKIDVGKLIRRSITFKQKILFVAVSGLILTSAVYTFNALRTERDLIRNEVMKKAEVVTELASHISELPLISQNPEIMKKAVSSLLNIHEVSFVSFYDKNAVHLLSKGEHIPAARPHPKEKMAIIETVDYFDLCSPVFTVREQEDIGIFQETETPLEIKEHVGWVRIGFSKHSMNQATTMIIRRGILIAFVFTALSIILVYKLFEVATRPLTSLSRAVKSVSRGSYPEIKVTSEDEIGELTYEFNRMSNSIKDRENLLVNQLHLSAYAADIGKALTESEDLESVLNECVNTTVKYFDPLLVRIWIYNKSDKVLSLKASAGLYDFESSPLKTVSSGTMLCGSIAKSKVSFATNDIHTLEGAERKWSEQNGVKSYTGYPLIVEKKLVGVLEIFSRTTFSGEVMSTMEYVSNELALGIQHKLSESMIKDSLKEKEILLREIHHRVKNNMQVISSLLNLQADKVKDQEYISIFNESRNRIVAMALVHEKLYRSEDMANIDFSDYIRSLVNGLYSFYDISSRNIALNLNIDNISLELDTAIPCGLIINELVSNSLKHGFPGNSNGTIDVKFTKTTIDGEPAHELSVCDNGAGVPEGLDIRHTKSLGLQLVTTLSEHQLQGTFHLDKSSGTKFIVSFKDVERPKRI